MIGRIALTLFLSAVSTALNWSQVHAVTVAVPVSVGTVSAPVLSEISGLVGSHALPGTLWVHNDSGDSARFFAISTAGALQGTYSLVGATATDWEDMAIGPRAGGGKSLYFADIGDNNLNRSEVSIYRTAEPLSAAGGTIDAANYERLRLQYPDGPQNAESFLVDPISGDLFIISKGSTAKIYRAPADSFAASQPVMLTALGGLGTAVPTATAADISPDGSLILVRNYFTTARLFQRGPGQSVGDALLGPGAMVGLAGETQGEALGWAADGSGFYTTSEFLNSSSQPIYFYAVTVPEPNGAILGAAGVMALLFFYRRRAGCAVDAV